MNDLRLQVVIPARNEAARLPRTLAALRHHLASMPAAPWAGLETIVVDNGSTDRTAAVAHAADSPDLPVTVVRCDRPGKGAAVAAGVAASDAGLVAYMDADGATAFDALERAVNCLTGGADVVVGSRAHPASTTTARHDAVRGVGASLYRAAARRVVPGIADTQCGFKLMRGDLARAVFREVRAAGFSFDVELLARLQARHAEIVELPVTWVDVPGSTFRPARHGAAAFTELAGIHRRTRPESRPLRDLFLVEGPDPLLMQQSLAPFHV